MFAAVVVLIHGAWLHASSWEPWCERYEARGYTCDAPAWPYLEGDPEELREHPPEALDVVTLEDVVARYADFVRSLPEPPVLIGHSFGGLVVLKLLDMGLGRAGVALEPAPPKSVAVSGTGRKAAFPVIKTWKGGQKSHPLRFDRWERDFAAGVSDAERTLLYDAYVVPAPGRPFFEVFWAAFHKKTKVDFDDASRAPLMLVAGTEDRVIPEEVVARTWRRYEGNGATTVLQEFDRTHGIVFEPGWEEVADLVISWVEIETGLRPEPPQPPSTPTEIEWAEPPAPR